MRGGYRAVFILAALIRAEQGVDRARLSSAAWLFTAGGWLRVVGSRLSWICIGRVGIAYCDSVVEQVSQRWDRRSESIWQSTSPSIYVPDVASAGCWGSLLTFRWRSGWRAWLP